MRWWQQWQLYSFLSLHTHSAHLALLVLAVGASGFPQPAGWARADCDHKQAPERAVAGVVASGKETKRREGEGRP